MSYPSNPTSLLAMLDSTGATFIEQQGHTALHKVMRANAAAGIVSAAAAVETVAKLDSINDSFVALGNDIAQGQAADAQLEARVVKLEALAAQDESSDAQLAAGVALLQLKAEALDRGLERLHAREHQVLHAIAHAHRFATDWLQQTRAGGPMLALGLADASHFWLLRAARILEDTEFAGETVAQRIAKIRDESTAFAGLVQAAEKWAEGSGLADFVMAPGASLQLPDDFGQDATLPDAREAIARRAGLALWLFTMVALTHPSSPVGEPVEADLPAPAKAKAARRTA